MGITSAFSRDMSSLSLEDYATLLGTIKNKKTGEALSGVTIYINDLKTGATSETDGTYKLENLPQSKVLVHISLVGYKSWSETIDLNLPTITKDVELEESITELHEIVITGLSHGVEKNRTATPIATISKAQLQQIASSNIIDAIATQPGISQITTGSGISKPVIRGLGYNRVVTVNDGIRQEGQQWGDEHGIEIDEFSVSKVEILKGPASLMYGSDAMAGVIHFLSAPTLPDGKIQGNVLANYQTNNGLVGVSSNVAGNLKGFIWDVRYSNKMAHAYKNRYDGYVLNSGFRENSLSGIVGVNNSWGYSHLHFSAYHFTPQIVEGERDSATGLFSKPIKIDAHTEGVAIGTNSDFKSYKPLTPFQKIHHYKAVLNNSFIVVNGSLKTTLGVQQNQRQEYGNILAPNDYGLFFLLNTINYESRYIFPEKNQLNVAFGINGMQQNSQNKGTEYLVPEYNLFDAGMFIFAKKTVKNLDISGGLRYDSRKQRGKDLFLDADGKASSGQGLGEIHQFTAFNSTFSGVSGSLGATYQITDDIYTKLNISRGFRAPNISELGANGVHTGTIRYEIGNPNLKAENSFQFDYALGMNTQHLTAELNLFNNNIHNFIFPRQLNSIAGGDSLTEGYQTFKYFAADARLWGGEISVDIHPHPLDWLHIENTFSYVHSEQKNQPDSTKYLPFTPPAKFTTELRANAKTLFKNMKNAYFKLGLEYYFAQNRFYAAYNTETRTPSYTLINMGLGTDFVAKKRTFCSFYISLNNLLDVAYQSHLSRLKYLSENNVTGRAGVFNMGRNLSLKLLVPIGIK